MSKDFNFNISRKNRQGYEDAKYSKELVFVVNKFGKGNFGYWFLFFWHINLIGFHLIKLRGALPWLSITTNPQKGKAPPSNQ